MLVYLECLQVDCSLSRSLSFTLVLGSHTHALECFAVAIGPVYVVEVTVSITENYNDDSCRQVDIPVQVTIFFCGFEVTLNETVPRNAVLLTG